MTSFSRWLIVCCCVVALFVLWSGSSSAAATVVAREQEPHIYRGPDSPTRGPRPLHTLKRVESTAEEGGSALLAEMKLHARKLNKELDKKNSRKKAEEKKQTPVDDGAAAAAAPAEGPDGKYCGSFSVGLIKGFVMAKREKSTFDIHLEGLNQNLTCTDEEFVYDPETHHADVPGARDPEDCLGEPLTKAKVTLDVVYAPEDDVVTLDFGFTHVDCKKCE